MGTTGSYKASCSIKRYDKEYFKCSECGEIKEADDLGESTLAMNDIICRECLKNGYGD